MYLLIYLAVLFGGLTVLALLGYLSACAGAERWLTLKEWLG